MAQLGPRPGLSQHSKAWLGMVQHVVAWLGTVWLGIAWHSLAQGTHWHNRGASLAWSDPAGHSLPWLGIDGHSLAQHKHGQAYHSPSLAWLSMAQFGLAQFGSALFGILGHSMA